MGEHCDWFKHDNYEDATRIVTIIKPADGLLNNPKPPGTIIEQLAEEVDMYPSLLVSSSSALGVSVSQVQRILLLVVCVSVHLLSIDDCSDWSNLHEWKDLHGMPVPAELQGESWVPLLEKSSASHSGKQRSVHFHQCVLVTFGLVCLHRWALRLGAGCLASTHMASGNWSFSHILLQDADLL
eukprot:COSAG02_NODE_548_length_20472_cov_5.958524_4_plen_183_part_00